MVFQIIFLGYLCKVIGTTCSHDTTILLKGLKSFKCLNGYSFINWMKNLFKWKPPLISVIHGYKDFLNVKEFI